jgi:ribulose-phosphate 3-epimerase
MEIIPAILERELKSVLRKIEIARSLGVETVQLDVMDGVFVNNTSYGVPDHHLASCRMNLEVHLMVANPLAEMARWRRLRNAKRAIIHWEAAPEKNLNQKFFLSIALNPDTPISVLKPHLGRINHVLMMGVRPGWSGQKFDRSVLDKIKAFKMLEGAKHITVGVDGGVNRDTAPLLNDAGADILNVASFLWQGDIQENYRWLKSL